MDWLLWILIGLGAALLALGLYYFNTNRRREQVPFPLDDHQRGSLIKDPFADPLVGGSVGETGGAASSPFAEGDMDGVIGPVKTSVATPVARNEPSLRQRREPQLDGESQAEFDEFGVGAVRLRPQDEAVAARLAAGRQRRTPRFSYKASSDDDIASPGRSEPKLEGVRPPGEMKSKSSSFEERPAPPSPQSAARIADAPKTLSRDETGAPQQPEKMRAPDAPDVIPLYLVARQPAGFAGSILLELFARMGFEFGEMDVYHYYPISSGSGDAHEHALFSLMNGVAPGTFDPQALPGQSTPALAFFLRLPIERQPALILEQFLELAYRMADELDARLLDDRREDLSTESVDRMRAIVLED
ncbi:MAG: cell division protein ZipA C-terminal FtsZ-binding domain-containing protein [Pseudomonadota bacterium]